MKKKNKEVNLIKVENFLNYQEKVEAKGNTFQKLMVIYQMAIKELETKLEILKEEFKIFYDYDLIDHINTRVKRPESIIAKMSKKGYELTYKGMIENINDIAGIRIITPMIKDIFTVRKLIAKIPGIKVLKEKDYVTKPKESGYSSYHMIIEVPVTLSKEIMYVKVEVQIRTMAMDFWASLEHKMKYKGKGEITKKQSKDLVAYAKIINKLDGKIMLMRE